MATPLKCCTGCGNEFPPTSDYFHRDSTKADGLHPKCKTCRKSLARKYFVNNAERILTKNAKWKEDNPDRVAALAKAWAQNHPERRKEIKQRFAANNPDKNTEYARRWRDANREQYREIDRRYRANTRERQRKNAQRAREQNRERYRNYLRNRLAKQKAVGGTLTAEDIQCQYESQHGLCYWCSQDVGLRYHVDHVIPLSRNGSNGPENVVIACPFCNQSKSDKLPYVEWIPPNPLCPRDR